MSEGTEENVVPFVAPEEYSSPEACTSDCSPPEDCTNEATPAPTPESETRDGLDMVDRALAGVDISKVTPEEVFRTIMGHSQEHAFRLLCSVRLMEQVLAYRQPQSESQEPVQPTGENS